MKKKLLSLLLCVLLAFSLLPLSAFALDSQPVSLTGLEIHRDHPLYEGEYSAEKVFEINTNDEALRAYMLERLNMIRPDKMNAAMDNKPMSSDSYYQTVAEAGAELRKQFKNRPVLDSTYTSSDGVTTAYGFISISYQAPDAELDTAAEREAVYNSIQNTAYAVTGDPQEGDYLRKSICLFFTEPEYDYSSDNGTTYLTCYYVAGYWGNVTYEQEQEVAAAADAVLDSLGFTSKTSGYDKIKAIYDWIGTNIQYDTESIKSGHEAESAFNQTAYSAIIERDGTRKTICAGYSHLMHYMMWKSQIPTRIINGSGGTSSNRGGHAWNLTYLRGKWYSMDVTWDEGKSYSKPASHDFFLRGKDSGFYDTDYNYHLADKEYKDLINASSTSNYGDRRSEDNGACAAHTSASTCYTTDSGAVVHWCSKCGQSVLGDFGPVITTQPKDVSVAAGETAKFKVAAKGTGTLKYQWQYSTNGSTWSNTTLTGYNTATLSVKASAANDGRYYRCVVSDSQGSTNSNGAKLTVIPGPTITAQPKDVSAVSGSKATFTVKATGTGTLTYQWQWSSDGTTWKDTTLTGYNTATLTVTASANVNGRYYRCMVTDSKGSIPSDAAKLTVTAIAAPTGLTAANNLTTGRVKLSWNAVSGATGYNIYRSKTEDGDYEKLNDTPVTELTYTDGRSGNAGITYWYKITAVKGSDESDQTEAVSRIAKCQRPANLKATANSDGSVTLTWDAPLVKGSVSGYRVYLWDTAKGAFQWIDGSLKADGTATTVKIPASSLTAYKGKTVQFSLRGFNTKDILGTISIYAAPASAKVK